MVRLLNRKISPKELRVSRVATRWVSMTECMLWKCRGTQPAGFSYVLFSGEHVEVKSEELLGAGAQISKFSNEVLLVALTLEVRPEIVEIVGKDPRMIFFRIDKVCLLYTSPSPRDRG